MLARRLEWSTVATVLTAAQQKTSLIVYQGRRSPGISFFLRNESATTLRANLSPVPLVCVLQLHHPLAVLVFLPYPRPIL